MVGHYLPVAYIREFHLVSRLSSSISSKSGAVAAVQIREFEGNKYFPCE